MDIVKTNPKADELKMAEQFILLSAMPETVTAWQNNKLDSLLVEKVGMIVVTRGRLGSEGLSALLGPSYLPVLMPSSRAAYLYMYKAHCGDYNLAHKGIVETLARSRSFVWVHRGRDLAKRICKNCPSCTKKNKKLLGQQMACRRPESVSICRPWTHVSLGFVDLSR